MSLSKHRRIFFSLDSNSIAVLSQHSILNPDKSDEYISTLSELLTRQCLNLTKGSFLKSSICCSVFLRKCFMSQEEDNSPDQIAVNEVQVIRNQFIGALMPAGKIPQEKDERELLRQLLSDKSSTAVARLRIKTDKEKAKNEAAVAAQIAHAISKYDPSKAANRNMPVSESVSLPVVQPLPGETEIGVIPVTYHSILGDDTVS